MIPQVFSIGYFPVNSFGLMVALSLIVGTFCLAQSFREAGIDQKYAEKYVFTGGISGLLGARIWYLAEHFAEIKHNFFGALFSSAGFTFYGGFIIAFVILYILSKKDKVPQAKLLDSVGPTLALGYAIGRLGCQLSGDGDYGIETDSFLGMSYSTGVVPTAPGITVYPTPFFESFICICIFFLLKRLRNFSFFQLPYRQFSAYLIFISLERFLIEFLRINPKHSIFFTHSIRLSEAQVVSLGLGLLGVALLVTSITRNSLSWKNCP
jgi:phosphatidylglycerol---prolipoprotein diacylglyceryl transferase